MWLLLLFFVVLCFGLVVAVGAPYVPTLKQQNHTALELLGLKPGQTLLELGSGDGRVLKAAAAQGINAIGYELNPLLLLWSRLATWRYRRLIKVYWRNFWKVNLPKTDGIYVFLLNKYMLKLDKKITQETTNSVKLVSYGFKIPNKKPQKVKNGLFLYTYNSKTS